MKKNTLLIINVALNWGSTGKIVDGIGKLARSNGWDVYVAHGARYRNASELKAIQVTSRYGEMLHYVESTLFDAQGLGSRCATKRFLKKMDEIKPDLVHIHNIHGCFINYPRLFTYLKEHKIPVVWTLHDCWAMTGHCVHFMRTHCDKWKTVCYSCPQLRDFPSSYLLDRSRRNYELKKSLFTSMPQMHVTTVSDWLKGVAEDSYFKVFPIDVVYNGVDTNQFQYVENDIRKRLHIEGKKMVLAVASGFEERKGIYDYITLGEMLPEEYQIVLVGTNEHDRKVLSSNVITVPRTNGVKELVAYYSAADVLLSLSYEETFGLTIAEAMSCGTPAIVYDNTAQPELVTPETGRVVHTGDVESVKNAIIEVCQVEKMMYSDACRSRVLDNYDKEKQYTKYMNIYKKLIHKYLTCGGGVILSVEFRVESSELGCAFMERRAA